jgi:RNA polymerase sigma factor (sigma-70 family)
MDETEWLAERFEQHRPHLRTVAYQMLGSASQSESAVQEAWLRLSGGAPPSVVNVRAWLTTVVGGVCLEALQARQTPRGLSRVAANHASPPRASVVTVAKDQDDDVPPDAVGLALLVVLEALTSAERVAFVLHDMFAIPFDEIAAIVGRTPAGAEELARRARRRVRGATPEAESFDLRERADAP